MLSYKNSSLTKYLDKLAARTPVPGGGSASALAGALGAALISMVASYSKGKNRSKIIDRKIAKTLRESESIRKRLLILVDLDAEAYLDLCRARMAPLKVRKKALKKAREVPREICQLCYRGISLTPFLVRHGSPYLLSDIQVAVEFLLASFNASLTTLEVNQ